MKLSPPFYQHLAILSSDLLALLRTHTTPKLIEPALALTYKLVKLAERVVERGKPGEAGGMRVMVEDLGRSPTVQDHKWLEGLLGYLARKQKKKVEPKGVMGATKSWLSSLTGRKEETVPN